MLDSSRSSIRRRKNNHVGDVALNNMCCNQRTNRRTPFRTGVEASDRQSTMYIDIYLLAENYLHLIIRVDQPATVYRDASHPTLSAMFCSNELDADIHALSSSR